MIGCIVTGHGEFAPGLSKALTMIAGKQENFQVIAFEEGLALDTYEENIRATLEGLLSETEGVLIFTDLLGGTPFRTAMMASSTFENVEILTGTNLPMLIEIGLMRTFESDVKSLAKRAVEVGTEGIQHVVLEDAMDEADDSLDNDEEGI